MHVARPGDQVESQETGVRSPPEYVIRRKLEYYRDSGSDRHLWYLSRFTFVTLHGGWADLGVGDRAAETWITLLRWGILTS